MSTVPTRWLFVCTGNTCRSPMAAVLCRAEAARRGLPIEVTSAGLAAEDGHPASDHAIEAVEEIGLSLRDHRAARLTIEHCDRADKIVVMSESHRAVLLAAGVAADKIAVAGGGVPDPFGGDLSRYRDTRDALESAIAALLPPIRLVPMEARHVPTLAAIERDCFSDPWSEAAFAEELDNPVARFTVAESLDGRVLGYLGWHAVADEGFVANVAVTKGARRKGVAGWLLARAAADARAGGQRRLALEVRASNGGAQALYEQYGFVRDGRRFRFYRDPEEDALLYSLYFRDGEAPYEHSGD